LIRFLERSFLIAKLCENGHPAMNYIEYYRFHIGQDQNGIYSK